MGTRLNTILAAAALAISSTLLVAPAADADGVPKTKTNKIVVGKSLAGVKIGMTMKKAAKKWKKGASIGGCYKPSYSKFTECIYELEPSSANYTNGWLKYTGNKKVSFIAIRTNHDTVHSFPNKLLNRYRTADGIGIGSKLKKLKRVFGKKLKKTYAKGPDRVYEVKGPGKRRTVFSTYKPAGKKPFVAYLSINKR